MKTRAGLVLFIAVISVCIANPKERWKTEVLWDTYGVPHVFAEDERALFRAFGWAQMKNHGDLVLKLYGEARGRAAEYWGVEHLESDRWVRLNGVPGRARMWYRNQSVGFRANIDAFAEGMNAYALAHPNVLDKKVKAVLPITGIDVLAHVHRVIHFSFLSNERALLSFVDPPPEAGSNAWVIGPSRSASGHALMMVNPHLQWGGHFTLMEAQLVAPRVSTYGVTFVGFPVLGIAFNDHLGWSHTVNTIDGVDLFELEPAEGGYLLDGTSRRFETRTEIIRILRANGSLDESPFEVRHSVHGAIIGTRNGNPVAMRVAGVNETGICEQWWQMGKARTRSEFEKAVRQLQIPLFTIMYADRAGNIMHVFNGQVPIRSSDLPGQWRGMVSGRSSSTLWTKMHSYQELPRLINPSSGWLQNANDPPWTTTMPIMLDRHRWPQYMAPHGMGLRAQRASRFLLDDKSITLDELIKYKHSTAVELADRIVDDLVAAARHEGTTKAEAAAIVLENWDRTAEAGSQGAVLFERFVFHWLRGEGRFREEWNENEPLRTPLGLSGPTAAVAALKAAADDLERRHTRLDVPWGQVFRIQRDMVDLPASGMAADPFGVMRALRFAEVADGRFAAVSGDTYVAVIEFASPVRARAVLGYGNASQAGSKHRTDQLELMARKSLRVVWRTRTELIPHVEHIDTF